MPVFRRRYWVAAGGEWIGKLASQHDAEPLAAERADEREQFAYVVRQGLLRQRLVAAFPRERRAEAEAAWAEHQRILFDASDEGW